MDWFLYDKELSHERAKTLNTIEDAYLKNNATKIFNSVDKVIFKKYPFADDFKNRCS